MGGLMFIKKKKKVSHSAGMWYELNDVSWENGGETLINVFLRLG